jgi:hypothetical protein
MVGTCCRRCALLVRCPAFGRCWFLRFPRRETLASPAALGWPAVFPGPLLALCHINVTLYARI